MKRVLRKLASYEKALKHTGEPSGIVFYDADDPGEPDESIQLFREKNPNWQYGVVCLPDNHRDIDIPLPSEKVLCKAFIEAFDEEA